LKKYFPVLKYINAPNAITSVSMCVGIISFIMFTLGNYKPGILLYAFTLFFDGIDGIIARRLKRETDFGAELDSFSDAVNFSVIPALIAYSMGFNNPIAICVLLLYVISGIWRLAVFNLNGLIAVGNKNCFTGLCTTQAAALFMISIAIYLSFFKGGQVYFMYPLFATLAVLMNLSFKCDKRGWLTKSLYLLIPAAIIVSFIKI
jgi:CDP-diacylglycerol--serine O-phosphatidyltransferase